MWFLRFDTGLKGNYISALILQLVMAIKFDETNTQVRI